METRGVLFDFGGTLLDYHREEIMRAVLATRGIKVTTEAVLQAYDTLEPAWNRLVFSELAENFTEKLRRFDRMIIEHLGVRDDLDILSTYIQGNWDRIDRQLPPTLVRRVFPDALPCLRILSSRGLKMGIVSNIQSEQQLRQEIQGINLQGFFPVLVASGSLGIEKPQREIFDLAANKIGLRPKQIMFVGDDVQRDYQGATGAGMNPVLIDRNGKHSSQNLNRVSSLEEIPRLI